MGKKRVKTDAFGFVLREIRHEKGITQDDLATSLDTDRSYISYLENGRRYPSIEMLISIAQAMEIRPGEILDRMAERLSSGLATPLEKQSDDFKPI